MKVFLQLVRPQYSLLLPLIIPLAVYYARDGDMLGHWSSVFVVTVSLSLVLMGTYVLNDVCDVAIDQINAPRRPIATGSISRKSATVLGAALVLMGILFSALFQFRFIVALVPLASLLLLYNLFSKRLDRLKPFAVATLTTTVYPLSFLEAGTLHGTRALTLCAYPAWLFCTALGYSILKELRDADGDAKIAHFRNSFQAFPERWKRIANTSLLCGALAAVLPAFLGTQIIYALFCPSFLLMSWLATRQPIHRALIFIGIEVFLVGLAALVDILVFP